MFQLTYQGTVINVYGELASPLFLKSDLPLVDEPEPEDIIDNVYINAEGVRECTSKDFRKWFVRIALPQIQETANSELKRLNATVNRLVEQLSCSVQKQGIYIISTELSNCWKIGRTDNFMRRVKGYNRDRVDKKPFTYMRPCYDCVQIETELKRIFKPFQRGNSELYELDYGIIKLVIDDVIDALDGHKKALINIQKFYDAPSVEDYILFRKEHPEVAKLTDTDTLRIIQGADYHADPKIKADCVVIKDEEDVPKKKANCAAIKADPKKKDLVLKKEGNTWLLSPIKDIPKIKIDEEIINLADDEPEIEQFFNDHDGLYTYKNPEWKKMCDRVKEYVEVNNMYPASNSEPEMYDWLEEQWTRNYSKETAEHLHQIKCWLSQGREQSVYYLKIVNAAQNLENDPWINVEFSCNRVNERGLKIGYKAASQFQPWQIAMVKRLLPNWYDSKSGNVTPHIKQVVTTNYYRYNIPWVNELPPLEH